jgi:replicative DNA helicase
MKIPTPIESERGIASITLNHPELVLNSISDAGFNPTFIYDSLSRDVVEVVLDQVSRRAVCDVRIIFEKLRERNDSVQFHELTELYTLMPIAGALKGLMDIVKNASKRRAVVAVLAEGMQFAESADVTTPELVNGLATGIERIRGEMTPPIRLDTQALIMNAITRYQEGDDQTQRIRTGYDKLDNLTPIRYGDFLVIGGPEKSGKTMLALNIIANILNETR